MKKFLIAFNAPESWRYKHGKIGESLDTKSDLITAYNDQMTALELPVDKRDEEKD